MNKDPMQFIIKQLLPILLALATSACGQGFEISTEFSLNEGLGFGFNGSGGGPVVDPVIVAASVLACNNSNVSYPASVETAIQDVCIETNNQRQLSGQDILYLDENITAAAMGHAQDMYARDYFSHISPEGEGHADRLNANAVTYTQSGENIAYGQPSGTAVVSAWMSSGPHRDNVLRSGFRRIGIGYAGKYWVQVFTD